MVKWWNLKISIGFNRLFTWLSNLVPLCYHFFFIIWLWYYDTILIYYDILYSHYGTNISIVLSFPHFVAGIPCGDELATQGVVWREILHVFMTVAEIFRRSFWAILRIEYEQVPPGTVCLGVGGVGCRCGLYCVLFLFKEYNLCLIYSCIIWCVCSM